MSISIVLFVDDFTKYTWIFPLKLKSETMSVFLKFNAFVDRHFSTKIQTLHTDWGGEFRGLGAHLETLGIRHIRSCPYIHQQNGCAERKHQHVVETGLSLLAQSTLPSEFWWDAFFTSTTIINVLPTPTLQNKSPSQVLYSKSPSLSQLR
ncbi:MAG: transposase, partial [Pedobacter sp.]